MLVPDLRVDVNDGNRRTLRSQANEPAAEVGGMTPASLAREILPDLDAATNAGRPEFV